MARVIPAAAICSALLTEMLIGDPDWIIAGGRAERAAVGCREFFIFIC